MDKKIFSSLNDAVLEEDDEGGKVMRPVKIDEVVYKHCLDLVGGGYHKCFSLFELADEKECNRLDAKFQKCEKDSKRYLSKYIGGVQPTNLKYILLSEKQQNRQKEYDAFLSGESQKKDDA